MSNQVNKIKYWCVKALTRYTFPDEPITTNNTDKWYCKNYPSLLAYESVCSSLEFEDILVRDKKAKNLFSYRNLELIIASIYNFIFKLYILISCFLIILLWFDISRSNVDFNLYVLLSLLILLALTGLVLYGAVKCFTYMLNQSYSETFCILQSLYIAQDLSSRRIADIKLTTSLRRRIKKLSRMIYLFKIFKQDKSNYYSIASQDIYNKVDWLNKPVDTTVKDLQIYFESVTKCLISGKFGNLPIDEALFEQKPRRKWEILKEDIENNIKFIERILPIIIPITKPIISIVKFFFKE